MSGFCGFAYIKTNKANIKRMVSFGDGRTKQMYKFLAPIVGFDYHFRECKTPELALLKAKKEIDLGYPVVIGALDMFYLEYYPKLYHHAHIPFHYVLMVGYDDAKEKIYLYDCGRSEMQELTYSNLLLAMGAEYEGLCKPNTICTIRMDNPKDMKYIAKTALSIKAEMFINPPTSFLGINGLNKLAKELPGWERELGKEETIKIFRHMVEFCGSVPTTPNRLLGINEKDEVSFMCSRDNFSKVLDDLGNQYQNDRFKEASILFFESGKQFEKMCNVLIDYILYYKDFVKAVTESLSKIGELEYSAYQLVQRGANDL